MEHLFAKIKEYLPGGARQLASLGHAARFFAALLVLTLVARGTAGAAMPRVETASPRAATLTRTVNASGTVAVPEGQPFELPAGLLVTEVCVQAGERVAAGTPLLRVDAQQLALAVTRAQAELRQMQVSYAQGMEPAKADDYGVQMSQRRLQEAYAGSEDIWNKGEQAVQMAEEKLDAARVALAAAQADRPQPPATPETATAETAGTDTAQSEWEARVAAAQSEVQAAEAAFEAAKANAEAANEAALDRAASAEQERDSALHSYEQALEAAQKAAAADQAAAGVTAAGIEAKKAELARLQALQDSGGAFLAPYDGTVTRLDVRVGSAAPAVGGLLTAAGTASTLTFPLGRDDAALVKVGTAVTVRQGSRTLDAAIERLSLPGEDGTVQASLTLNAAGGWQPGAAQVELKAELGSCNACLPIAAIRADAGGSFVYKVEEQDTVLGRQSVLVRIPVSTGQSGDTLTAVSGAVSPQDVIVVGADRPLSTGARVRLLNEGP